ncbi:hypothetical protein LMTR13_12640 [Bradyrhizobium icense]|uniref:Cytochrome c oxidase assembly protein n=1 Tax=Bradyrhizobium icense TaxID=1274631 RepID=A0A1B1URV2_9BRAD|nr:hypothetical protein LMTR13_12640 [Bradyrhizobium icense]
MGPANIWAAWSLAPVVTIPLVLFAALYAAGALRRARDPHEPSALAHEATAATAAVTLLAIALVSPLCRLSAALASVHMIQHVVLVALAPPLIVLASPVRTVGVGMLGSAQMISTGGWRELLWNRPLRAAGAYGILIWFWHVPAAYELALISASWHLAYLGSLIVASLWFWTCMLRATSIGAVALALLVTMVHTGLLGALLTFAPWPLYPIMGRGAMVFGFSPIEDQQLAGLIMWVPMGMIYLLSALVIVSRGLFAPSPEHSPATARSDR